MLYPQKVCQDFYYFIIKIGFFDLSNTLNSAIKNIPIVGYFNSVFKRDF